MTTSELAAFARRLGAPFLQNLEAGEVDAASPSPGSSASWQSPWLPTRAIRPTTSL